MNAPGGGPEVRTPNAFVHFMNMNEGVFSKDFLNRSILSHLTPKGDVTETHRNCPIGDPMEYLDKYREQLDAELRRMVESGRRRGRPLLPDPPEGHRMVDCTRTLGGILQVNGFTDFLGNYRSVRAACDPIGQSLGVLGGGTAGQGNDGQGMGGARQLRTALTTSSAPAVVARTRRGPRSGNRPEVHGLHRPYR